MIWLEIQWKDSHSPLELTCLHLFTVFIYLFFVRKLKFCLYFSRNSSYFCRSFFFFSSNRILAKLDMVVVRKREITESEWFFKITVRVDGVTFACVIPGTLTLISFLKKEKIKTHRSKNSGGLQLPECQKEWWFSDSGISGLHLINRRFWFVGEGHAVSVWTSIRNFYFV